MTTVSTSSVKVANLTHSLEQLHRVGRFVDAVKQSLSQAHMLDAFNNVALEHAFSAPVVATMQATPGFSTAVESFPEVSSYNIVPEHKSSAKQTAGLESLETAQADTVNAVCDGMSKVVSALNDAVSGLDETADDLQQQLCADRKSLEELEISDEVLALIPVNTLSDEAFSHMFSMLGDYISRVGEFNVDELRANPEKIRGEIDGLVDVVGDLGRMLGLEMTESGLVETDKNDEFVPTAVTMDKTGLNKANLLYYIDKADELCDGLKAIAAKKDDIIGSLTKEAGDMPTTLESDEVTYGANEHITLFCCFATLTTKLVRETIVLVSRLLTTVDAVVAVPADEAEPATEALEPETIEEPAEEALEPVVEEKLQEEIEAEIALEALEAEISQAPAEDAVDQPTAEVETPEPALTTE